MEGFHSSVDKKVLELCMGKNYHNPMVVYREYVQNSCDALYSAKEKGIISEKDVKLIKIDINPSNRTVCIKDAGTGVPMSQIGPTLVSIGTPLKDGIEQIGNYGIGRLVGANWCDEIIFETSAKGEDKKSILTFNARLAKEKIKDPDCQDTCDKILDDVTSLVQEKEINESHYFNVKLIHADVGLLDVEKVIQYLEETAPVDYKYTFIDDYFNESINALPEHLKELRDKEKLCVIYVNKTDEEDNENLIEKPYTYKVQTSTNNSNNKTIKLTRPTFFELNDCDYGTLAWGWYALAEDANQMNDVPFRGIRLRKHNMAIGNAEILNQYFSKPVSANYFVGEVFVANNNIVPSGSRDGLCPSIEQSLFVAKLEKKFDELTKVYNTLSKLRSKALTPLSSAIITKFTIEKKLLVSTDKDEITELKRNLKEVNTELDDAKKELQHKFSEIDRYDLKELSEDIIAFSEKESNKKVEEVNAKSENKIDYFSLRKIVEKERDNQKQKNQQVESKNSPESKGAEPDKNTSQPKETDVYKDLHESGYKIMKKVYSVLDGEKKLDPKTLERIKKKLLKKLMGDNA